MNVPLLSTVELGLIYSLVALGVYLSFRTINFPDLSVDGTFPLGAAVVATLITKGVDPLTATALAMLAGFLAGSLTGILHVKLRIMGLLAGILTMTALYSINMRIMGKPNIALLGTSSIFANDYAEIALILGVVLAIYITVYLFLKSQFGLSLRAAGMNPNVSRSYGVNIGKMTIFTLALSNAFVALAGALFAQAQGFADVSLGTGTIIIGLASVMIGEAIFRQRFILSDLLGCLIGSILYRFAIAIALNTDTFGLQASDLNLITSIIVITALIIPHYRRANNRKKHLRENV
jgi:putative ABC transport system permease protein